MYLTLQNRLFATTSPRTHLRLAALIALSFCIPHIEAVGQDDYRLQVTANRETAIYQTDETAKFKIAVTKGNQPVTEGKVSYVVDDFISEFPSKTDFPSGELELADGAEVPVTLTKPGFLRIRVTFQAPDKKKLQATAAAAFDPEKIKRSLPVPEDFDEFWNAQKKMLAEIAPSAELTSVENADKTLACFDAQVACLGAPVSGYLAKPLAAKPKSLPAILWVHGAGVRGSSLGNAINGARAGMLSMDINAHGLPNGKPGKFYQDQAAGPLKNYRYAGRESRDTTYFRGMYLRIVRAIDFLTAQPEWDGKTVVVIGHSQGGGQALVAGGIDERVTFIATGVPAICDHSGRSAGRINGWPKLVPTGADGKPDAKILQAARYVDAVNFASRCRTDAIMSVGFIDAVCPPSSCYAAYNSLQGEKQVINEPLMGHAAPQHIREAFFKEVLEHVKRKSTNAP